jgi:maltooligosyltrehalose trehalohydrolase
MQDGGPNPSRTRTLPVGSEPTLGGVHFRVWAPKCRAVEVIEEAADAAPIPLRAEAGGYFAGLAASARVGTLYWFRLDGSSDRLPDPCSRFQPKGPHGPSEVVDAGAFVWNDASWKGSALLGQVVYEMHVGTFTREGTWTAATRELAELAKLGITLVEIMPVGDFTGRFGWGYDGVDWFAPTRLYGRPDDFRSFVDRAHSVGIGVILDVVYNHFGPDGNYMSRFSDDYLSNVRPTEWGASINFDGKNSHGARELVVSNARYWIEEFHLDGLRLDATQSIFDESPRHILAEISEAVRQASGNRATVLIAENEPQHAKLVRPASAGGYGLDALWNDDYHHSAMVALTGRREAYYTDYRGGPQEFISAIKWGYLYQGQRYSWQRASRGRPALDVPPASFVLFLQNHDQISNSGRGARVHGLTSPGKYRALTTLTLLAPATPMLFQGQEFAASAPFLYFADHDSDLARRVHEGRNEFLRQFPSLALDATQKQLTDPADPQTFAICKLDFSERQTHAEVYALHGDLLKLRRFDPVFRASQRRGAVDGFVLGEQAFALRFMGDAGDRLLIVNLGRQLDLPAVPDPLFAPPEGAKWQKLWSSNEVAYGGEGTPAVETEDGVTIPGECAVVLFPVDH